VLTQDEILVILLLMETMRQLATEQFMNPETLNRKRSCLFLLFRHCNSTVLPEQHILQWEATAQHWYRTWVSLSLSDVLLSTPSSMAATAWWSVCECTFLLSSMPTYR